MKFRIAIGRCDCRPPYRDTVEDQVCNKIHETLASWRSRLPDDVAAFPEEAFDVVVDGRRVTFATYKVEVSDGETLLVCQALVHTWNRPTFLAIGNVGRMYAEGLLLTDDRKVEPAPDKVMWQFR
jgi:hypothetical protein